MRNKLGIGEIVRTEYGTEFVFAETIIDEDNCRVYVFKPLDVELNYIFRYIQRTPTKSKSPEMQDVVRN